MEVHMMGAFDDIPSQVWPYSPVFHVETSSGSINPATFDRTSRCPDEIVHRTRVTASYEDPNWKLRIN